MLTPHGYPDIALYRNRIRKDALKARNTGRDKSRQKDNAHSSHGRVALRDDAVAVEGHFWRRHDLVKPANRIDRKQVVNVANEHMVIEVGATARNSVATEIVF